MANPPDEFELRCTNPEEVDHLVRFVGGAAACTKVYGPGVTVSYVATGRYLLTWAANPGVFLGATPGIQATTQSDVKGHTVTYGVFDTSAFTLEVDFWNASDAAHDLAALEWITLRCVFAEISSGELR